MERKSDKHRILVVSHKPPYPPADGGCIAMENLLELLHAQSHELHYFFISTPKHPYVPDSIPAWLPYQQHFIDTQVSGKAFLRNLPSSLPYRARRFYEKSAAASLVRMVKEVQPELIMLESLYSAVYLHDLRQALPGVRIILRSHNIEWQIWENNFKQAGIKELLLRNDLKKLKNWEKKIWNSVDGILSISEEDSAVIQGKTSKPCVTSGFSFRAEHAAAKSKNEPPVLYHLGAMDWAPNVEGLHFFKDVVWPLVLEKIPEAEFHFAGKNMPDEWNYDLPRGWKNFGEVPDAYEFIKNRDILIVPIFSGGGIKIKVLEAMAAGKAIVSTAKGMEGLPVTPGKEVLIADKTVEDFAYTVYNLYHDAALYEKLSRNASLFLQEFCDPEKNYRAFQTLITEA